MIAGSLLAIVGTQVLGARPLRPRLRQLLHGRARGRGSTACAPASASSTASWPAQRSPAPALLIAAIIVFTWIQRGFGVLSEERLLVAASALIIVGMQVLFSSFLLSILGLRRRDVLSTDI